MIDQATLDKHVKSECKWGRSPSDPFTGVAFSEGARPTSLTELKTRIDHFVIKNLDRLGNVPRTLGWGSAESGVKTASATMKCIETKPTGMLLGSPSQHDEEARRKASKRKVGTPPNDAGVERVAPSSARRPKNEVDHATHEERLAQESFGLARRDAGTDS